MGVRIDAAFLQHIAVNQKYAFARESEISALELAEVRLRRAAHAQLKIETGENRRF